MHRFLLTGVMYNVILIQKTINACGKLIVWTTLAQEHTHAYTHTSVYVITCLCFGCMCVCINDRLLFYPHVISQLFRMYTFLRLYMCVYHYVCVCAFVCVCSCECACVLLKLYLLKEMVLRDMCKFYFWNHLFCSAIVNFPNVFRSCREA